MAWFPKAKKMPIRAGANDPPITAIGAILHVDAGNARSLFNYFNGPSGGIESHFHIPKWAKMEQYRYTGREADANYKANSFWKDGKRYGFISIETQGYGKGKWNRKQLRDIKRTLRWASNKHNFPLRVTPGPFSPGVGYHILHGSPGPWTPSSKSCPGPDRIKQFENKIVPWMNKVQRKREKAAMKNLQGKGNNIQQARALLLKASDNKFNKKRPKRRNKLLRALKVLPKK